MKKQQYHFHANSMICRIAGNILKTVSQCIFFSTKDILGLLKAEHFILYVAMEKTTAFPKADALVKSNFPPPLEGGD